MGENYFEYKSNQWFLFGSSPSDIVNTLEHYKYGLSTDGKKEYKDYSSIEIPNKKDISPFSYARVGVSLNNPVYLNGSSFLVEVFGGLNFKLNAGAISFLSQLSSDYEDFFRGGLYKFVPYHEPKTDEKAFFFSKDIMEWIWNHDWDQYDIWPTN